MARTAQKRPGDVTGRAIEQAQKEAAERQRDEQNDLTMAQQQEQEHNQTTVVDLTDPNHPKEMPLSAGAMDELEDGELQISDPAMVDPTLNIDEREVPQVAARPSVVVIQVLEDVEFIYGMGNQYDLKQGRNYRVPLDVANHLSEKGWLAFRSSN